MIRDRIVVGVYNSNLRERLLRFGDELTLNKAVDTCRAWEVTSSQVDSFKDNQLQVNSMQQSCGRGRSFQGRDHIRGHGTGQHGLRSNSQAHKHESKGQCKWCGYETHERKVCPAREAKCNFCHQKGHFKAVCHKKGQRVNFLQDSSQSTQHQDDHQGPADSDFLGYITKDMGGISVKDKQYDVCVKLDNTPVSFRADTGADVTVINKDTYDDHFSRKLLRRSSAKFRGPDLKELNICGYFNAEVKYRDKSVTTPVYVLPCSAQLLSREVCEKLGLVHFNSSVNSIEADTTTLFPELFTGLGKLNTEYDIKLDPKVQPYAVYAPRRVSLPLRNKVKAELDRLQKLGVIIPVKEPTPWCAPMVVVPKANGAVRICVDLTKLNTAVCRECHILPSVDHILGQMAGATVFSKFRLRLMRYSYSIQHVPGRELYTADAVHNSQFGVQV